MNSIKHRGHSFERTTKVEEWMIRVGAMVAVAAVAAALVFGALSSTGHVTW